MHKGIVKDLGVAAVGMTLTLATAGVSNLVAAAIGALSGGHVAKDLVPKLVDRFTEQENIRSEKSYFAWKVKKQFLR